MDKDLFQCVCGLYFSAIEALGIKDACLKDLSNIFLENVQEGGTSAIKLKLGMLKTHSDIADSFFIKGGEKVLFENRIYDVLEGIDNVRDLIPNRYQGHGNAHAIVTDFVEGSRADCVDDFDLDGFIGSYLEAMAWSKRKIKKSDYEIWLHDYFDSKSIELNETQNTISYNNNLLHLADIFSYSVFFQGKSFNVGDILHTIITKLKLLQPDFFHQLHGDLQPSNVIVKNDGSFKIIDRSNAIRNNDFWYGDIARDLAKMISHLESDYSISKIRDGLSSQLNSASDNALTVNGYDIHYNADVPESINNLTLTGYKHLIDRINLYYPLVYFITLSRSSQFDNIQGPLLENFIKGLIIAYEKISDLNSSDVCVADNLITMQSMRDVIISEYMHDNGIDCYRVGLLDRNLTGKSLFGSVDVNGSKVFYKISTKDSILNEIMGFENVFGYPSENILDVYYSGDYGIYFQVFNKDMQDDDGVLQSLYNKNLYQEDSHGYIMERVGDIHNIILANYFKTFHSGVKSGPNDLFFESRLVDDGRINDWYCDSKISFNGSDYVDFSVDGFDFNLHDEFNFCIDMLSCSNFRYFVESPGDLTEQNITKNAIFFDFEVAGMNSIAQEVSIYLIFSLFSGPFLLPQYGYDEYYTDDVDQFIANIDALFTENGGRLDISLFYGLPKLRKEIATSYLNDVLKPLLAKNDLSDDVSLRGQIFAAMTMRILGVKNINGVSEKDKIITLGVLGKLLYWRENGAGNIIDSLLCFINSLSIE